jgi:hypothetical protein
MYGVHEVPLKGGSPFGEVPFSESALGILCSKNLFVTNSNQ